MKHVGELTDSDKLMSVIAGQDAGSGLTQKTMGFSHDTFAYTDFILTRVFKKKKELLSDSSILSHFFLNDCK